jgi:transposase
MGSNHPGRTSHTQVLKRFTIDADADLLIGYVARHFPHHQVQCCYECCCCGYHIYHSLTAAGW